MLAVGGSQLSTIAQSGCRAVSGAARAPQSRPRVAAPPVLHRAMPQRCVRARGAGQDAVDSWVDLASFVSSAGGGGRTPYDELADAIGRDVYIDVAGWHLYLKDVKVGKGLSMAQALAAQLGPQLQGQRSFREADLADLAKKVPVKLGGGKVTVSLADVVPAGCMRDFERACEDFARNC